MTVSSTVSRVTYTATGGTTFAYTFRIFAKTDLVVYDNSDLQTVDVDYSVTGVGSVGGGNVVFSAPPTVGHTIIIFRVLPLTQETDYQEGDPFPAETHESALDRLIMIAQQFSEAMERFLKLPEDSPLSGIEVPVGAGQALRWNSLATNFELFTIDVSSTSVINAKGDLIYGEVGGVPERLPIGAEGIALSVQSGKPKWQAPKLDDLAEPDDNTDLDVSTTKHGLVPKAPNDPTKVLIGTGAWGSGSSSKGHFSNLIIKPDSDDILSSQIKLAVSADSIVVINAIGVGYEMRDFSVTLNLSASGAGGLDTGDIANDTWYFIWAIWDGTTKNVLASLSASSPTMPGSYTYKKLLSCVRNIGRDSHLHMDGADQGTVFTDESGKIWTAVGDAKTMTSDKVFGTAAAVFDGVGDYITIGTHPDHEFGFKDFTISMRIKRGGGLATTQYIAGKTNSTFAAPTDYSWAIALNTSNQVVFYISDGTSQVTITGGTIAETTTWHHVVISRQGAWIKIFIDGTGNTPTACAIGSQTIACATSIGRAGEKDANYYNGKMDEVSITKGVAAYWDDFTPPVVAYPDLCLMRRFYQADRLVQCDVAEEAGTVIGSTSTAAIDLSTHIPANIVRGITGKIQANGGSLVWLAHPTTFTNSSGVWNHVLVVITVNSQDIWHMPILRESQKIYHQVSANTVNLHITAFELII